MYDTLFLQHSSHIQATQTWEAMLSFEAFSVFTCYAGVLFAKRSKRLPRKQYVTG